MDCTLEVAGCGFLAQFNFIVVFLKGLYVISIFSGLIRHNPYKGAVGVKYALFDTQDSRGYYLVEITVTPHQEVHIGLAAD